MNPTRPSLPAIAALLAATITALPAGAAPPPMAVMESRPAARAVMSGAATEVFVRFDAPVDHAASALSILHDGHVVASLHARLGSQPNTLYANAGRLPPGGYTLHWRVRSTQDRAPAEGDIPFSVR